MVCVKNMLQVLQMLRCENKNAETQSHRGIINEKKNLCVFASLRLITYIQLCTPSEVAIAVSIAASV